MKKFLHLCISVILSMVFHFRRVNLKRRLTQICQRKEVIIGFSVDNRFVGKNKDMLHGHLSVMKSKSCSVERYHNILNLIISVISDFGYGTDLEYCSDKTYLNRISFLYTWTDEKFTTYLSNLIYSQVTKTEKIAYDKYARGVNQEGDDK